MGLAILAASKSPSWANASATSAAEVAAKESWNIKFAYFSLNCMMFRQLLTIQFHSIFFSVHNEFVSQFLHSSTQSNAFFPIQFYY